MEAAEAEAVDAVEPERAVREVEPGEVVAVADELGDDLAEPERHDRQVVAAQAQGRGADQDAEERREERRDEQTSQRLRWMPAAPVNAVPPTLTVTCGELLRAEPARHVGAGGEERDVAEVEQPRVADDEVEAERPSP